MEEMVPSNNSEMELVSRLYGWFNLKENALTVSAAVVAIIDTIIICNITC